MDLIKKMDMFMLNEAKTKITPYLNSIFSRQDKISKEQANTLSKELDKVKDNDISYLITISNNGEKLPYIVIKGKGDQEVAADKVKNVLSNNGWTATVSEKGDAGAWVVRFK